MHKENPLPQFIPNVFEQYEYKGFLITIKSYYRREKDLIGFACLTKYAHLLNIDNYENSNEIFEENEIVIYDNIDTEDEKYKEGECAYFVIEPDDVMTWMRDIDSENVQSILNALVEDILEWKFVNSGEYEYQKSLLPKPYDKPYNMVLVSEYLWDEYKNKNSPIVLKQINKKTIKPKSSKKQRGFNQVAWSSMVKLRDGKCAECGSVYDLHAHHIKQYKTYPELRYDVNNGITLCGTCHRKWHSQNGR